MWVALLFRLTSDVSSSNVCCAMGTAKGRPPSDHRAGRDPHGDERSRADSLETRSCSASASPTCADRRRPSRHGIRVSCLSALAALVLAAFASPSARAATEIYVNKDAAAASDNCNTHGSSTTPLATVGYAVGTCAPAKADDVNIIVLCDALAADCDYDLPAAQTFAALPGGRHAAIRGEPYQMVRFRQPYLGSGSTAIHIESNWTLSGFVFDGMRDDAAVAAEPTGGDGFVRLQGDHILFTHNEVTNTPYICVGLVSGSDIDADQHTDIEISHNYIHSCHSAKGGSDPAASIDRHCIYNRITRSVLIAFNDVTECGGDGYAIENYLFGNPDGVQPVLSEVALDNTILGNRFWTTCVGGVSWGENALDVKRSGAGLVVRDNAMWGYRQADDKSVACHGTGTGDPGYAIVVHGQLESANGTEGAEGIASSNGPVCSGTPRCAVIEGNDISNSQQGLTIGTDGSFPLRAQGRTYGVDVRGNVIHDLRGIDNGDPARAANRGLGIAMTTTDATAQAPSLFNRVYRNVLANVPGDSFYVGSLGTEFAHSFSLRNNLITWTGQGLPCKQRVGTLPDDHRDNFWYESIPPTIPPGQTTPAPQPEFVLTAPPPFRAAVAPAQPPTCGTTVADPPTPDPFNGLAFDYRLLPGVLDDQGGTDPAFGEPYTNEGEMCGPAFDIGPRERCNDDQKVFLRETSDPNPDRDQELSSGVWWLSPDIGVWDSDGVTPYAPVAGDTALRQDTPFFKKNATTSAMLLIRIRSENPPPPTEPIHVRMWGAPYHTSISFPREFTAYVDRDVYWDTASNDLIDSGPGWRVYAFPWKVVGAKHPRYVGLEHFCLRAEISTRFDRKPPFMTPIDRSNNLAQRNVAIDREPVASANILFRFEDVDTPLIVRSKVARNRHVYLYFPDNAARLWRNEGVGRLADTGRLRAITERTSTLRPRAPARGQGVGQLMIDSRDAGVPDPSESISIVQPGHTGVVFRLNQPGFRESFEWGIPRDWTASPAWAALDLDKGDCSTARLGRRAAAFIDERRCTYEGGRSGGLTSPQFLVPRRRGPIGVTFFQWARAAPRSPLVREVWLVTSNRTFRVRKWAQPSQGSKEAWLPVYIDLKRFQGHQVRLRFIGRMSRPRPYAGYLSPQVPPSRPRYGWFIDDIALN